MIQLWGLSVMQLWSFGMFYSSVMSRVGAHVLKCSSRVCAWRTVIYYSAYIYGTRRSLIEKQTLAKVMQTAVQLQRGE